MEKILVKENPVKEILALCVSKARVNKTNIKDLCRIDYRDNQAILDKYFRNEFGQACFYANLLYFRDIEGIKLEDIKKELKKDFKEPISLAGYKYNPEHYKFESQAMQDEYEEDLFKNKDRELEELEKREEYKYKQIDKLDYEAVNSLMSVLFSALKKRWIMLLNLEDIPGLVNNALECEHLGVSCKPSNMAMRAKIEEIKTLMTNKEVIEWLKTNPTDLAFDKCDYVNTYQRILRQITDIRDSKEISDILYKEAKDNCRQAILNHDLNSSINYFRKAVSISNNNTDNQWRDLLENSEDLWIEDIIANEAISIEQYIENVDNDEDYLDNSEMF